jgi:hypothetical protein
MIVLAFTDAKAADFVIDLATEYKPNSSAATAAGLAVPLTRHQVTVVLAGTGDVQFTLTVKPTGTPGFEGVTDGVQTISPGEQVTFIVRDCSVDEIKVGTGVLATNTYTVYYTGTGDYIES